MNITQQNIDELNATVSLTISPDDYESKVKKVLLDYQKRANVPGFRPGKVPMGMITKMYRTGVMADEVNKLLSEHLYKYIEENKLQVLGNPLPKEDEKIDLQSQAEFTFKFDLGLAPKIDVNLTEKDKFNLYKIKVDDALIEKYITDIARRYGKVSEADKAEEKDMISGEFVELDKNGEIVPNGITNTSTIAIEFVEDDKTKKQLIGLKVGDILTVDPNKVSKGTGDLAQMLNISRAKAEKISAKFQVTVKHIYRVAAADVNQELFDKAFGPNTVNTLEQFKEKLADELTKAMANDSERFLKKEIAEYLLKKLDLNLPDDFLKRWLLDSNKEKITPEILDEEYEEYAKSLRWQLIENKLIEQNDIKITREEAENKAKELFKRQMESYGYGEVPDEHLAEAAKNILSKQEDAKRIYDDLFEQKVLAYMKQTVSLKEKEVSFDDFVKLASGKPAKGKILETLNNLVSFK